MATDLPAAPDVTLLPLLPLRDVVVFPHMVIPLFVGRPKSIKALDIAMDSGKHILLVAQKSAAKDDPGAEDLYPIGCVATVLQMLKLPDGTVKVLVEGKKRARVRRFASADRYWAIFEDLRRDPPSLPKGSFVVAASAREDFKASGNRILAVHFTVSDLVLLTRQEEDGGVEVTVLSGATGAPASGARVTLYRYDWQKGHHEESRQTVPEDGAVHFESSASRRGGGGRLSVIRRAFFCTQDKRTRCRFRQRVTG